MGIIHFCAFVSMSMSRSCDPKDNLETYYTEIHLAFPEFVRKLCRWVETEIAAGIIQRGWHDDAELPPHSSRVNFELELPSVWTFTWSLCLHEFPLVSEHIWMVSCLTPSIPQIDSTCILHHPDQD